MGADDAAGAGARGALSRPMSCRPEGGGTVDGRFGYLRMVAEDAVRDIAFELEEPMLCDVAGDSEGRNGHLTHHDAGLIDVISPQWRAGSELL